MRIGKLAVIAARHEAICIRGFFCFFFQIQVNCLKKLYREDKQQVTLKVY